jgi:hypothetical protein
MIRIDNTFEFGDIVYLKTDTEQLPRIVIGIKMSAGGGILYELSQDCAYDYHYEIEISTEPNILIKTTY